MAESDVGQKPAEATGPVASGLWRYAALVAVAVFATSFSQQKVPMVGGLPTTFLLKNGFKLEQSDVSIFFFWAAFAWNLKPVAGVLTDAFPLFGTRRRHYMMLGALGASLSWGVMGAFSGDYTILLTASIIMNICLVFSSSVMGGMMVEAGQAFGAPGRMTSLRQIVQSGAVVIAPMVGGYFAERAYGLTAGVAGTVLFALAVTTFFVQKEQAVSSAQRATEAFDERARYRPPVLVVVGLVLFALVATSAVVSEALHNVGLSLLALEFVLVAILVLAIVPTQNLVIRRAQSQLTQIFQSRSLWLACVMYFLFYTVPGLNTALTYYQSDVLKFDTEFMGGLTSIEGGVGLVAALLYAALCRRFPLRTMLLIGVGLAGMTTFGFLYYTHDTAPFVHGLAGFFGVVAELAMMDLAVRSTPKGCEALGFSLMMSVRNFGISLSDVLGTMIMDKYKVSFESMVTFNGSTTLLAIVFVFFLPAAIIMRREGDPVAAH